MSTKKASKNKNKNYEQSQYVNEQYFYLKLHKKLQSINELNMKSIIIAINFVIDNEHFDFEMTRDFDIKNWFIQCKNINQIQQLIDKKIFIHENVCKFNSYHVEKTQCFYIDHEKNDDYFFAMTIQKIVLHIQFWMNRLNVSDIKKNKKMMTFARNSNVFKFETLFEMLSEYNESFKIKFHFVNLNDKVCQICKHNEHFEIICSQLLIVMFEKKRNLKCLLKNRSIVKWIQYTFIFSTYDLY